ncbi:MAG: glutamyl-tRNA reductase [Mobiluncus porci]|uniref:glutamyl-tRNA reductase n=1 Tax=Mobiluncus TaxID=2050 RepID=UPI0023F54E5E|nr:MULTISPECIES: glutamyl-tRNA reductase [Mobiluncus]MCI6583520.1 glutamyl-tRNA reductase [Mobiluncus sp.]MDD7540898.1 glutamyl-tRNA reductase [Mobiluncus porci]MDY5748927.1 glutamyl-tRNA reductase [Mobiluncus porci]
MPFQLYTVNHLTHSLDEVSRAATLAEAAESQWRDRDGVHSLVILSTCNRVEVYVSADPEVRLVDSREVDEEDETAQAIPLHECDCHAHQAQTAIPPADTSPNPPLIWNFIEGREVAEHLYRVAAGLDSMVVGEAEVAGQVRRAFTRAQELHEVNGLMIRMFEGALATSRRVSSETSLTGLGRSVVSVALDLAAGDLMAGSERAEGASGSSREVAGASPGDSTRDSTRDWRGIKALLVGTGAYAGNAVAQLRARGVRDLANVSTSARVHAFAQAHGTRVIDPANTVNALAEADLVVACRGIGAPVLTREQVAAALALREVHRNPLIILDLALHRDVEETVRDLGGVKMWSLEDIRGHVPALAVTQIRRANAIIEEGLADYDAAVAARHMDPAIVQLRAIFEQAAGEEIERLPQTDLIPRDTAIRAIRHVVAKLAHTPTVSAHMAAESGLGADWVEALATVWGLTPEVLEAAFVEER